MLARQRDRGEAAFDDTVARQFRLFPRRPAPETDPVQRGGRADADIHSHQADIAQRGARALGIGGVRESANLDEIGA